MSEPTQAKGAAPGARFYSKDYWDLVFEQLGRRRLFKASMAVLAVLYALAIYAPLIANDRPWSLTAIDYRAYDAAARSISAVGSSVTRLLEQGPEAYAESRGPEAPPTLAEALAQEREALRLRVATMTDYLPEEEHAPLELLLDQVDEALALSAAGRPAEALALGEEAKAGARAVRKDYKSARPPEQGEDGAAPEVVGKLLVPRTDHPLRDSLVLPEIFFMSLWALLLSWPLWNRVVNRGLLRGDRERIRRARRAKLAAFLLLPLGACLAWWGLVGSGGSTFDLSPYKAGLTAGEIVAVGEPDFPLLAMGYSETHSEESFRPPTWKANAEIDEEGYYTTGARVPEADPVTGYLPPGAPVDVRVGELARNDPMRHPMGTDGSGRDFLVRLLWGGRVSLAVGIVSAFLLTIIGVVVGSIAGYFGGWVDVAIMRIIEVLQSIPAFFLILMVMAFTDPNVLPPIFGIVLVIALVRWTGVARLVRGEFLRARELEFVLAARSLGFSSARTIFRHVLPNAMSPVIVSGAFSVAAGILTESAVSFLGFGISHPAASWGALVNESRNPEHWWIMIFPGLVIFLTVTCYNLAGDALRDALDPKMKD